MKTRNRVVRRQVFVFTPQEKRAAACVIGAFLLGLGTMYYRSQNPRPPPAPSMAEQKEANRTATRSRAERASATGPARSPSRRHDRRTPGGPDKEE